MAAVDTENALAHFSISTQLADDDDNANETSSPLTNGQTVRQTWKPRAKPPPSPQKVIIRIFARQCAD